MRSRSASRRAILFEQACDERWWKEYAEELEKFRRLRNTFEPEREAAMRIHLAAGFRQVDTDGDCCVMEYRW